MENPDGWLGDGYEQVCGDNLRAQIDWQFIDPFANGRINGIT